MIESDSKFVWAFGLPLERLEDGTYCQRAGGRPSGSGTYGEHTTLMRIPDSALAEVKAILARKKQEWDKVREQVQGAYYTTPGLDLNNLRIVPRPAPASAQVVTVNQPAAKVATISTSEINKRNNAPARPHCKRRKRR